MIWSFEFWGSIWFRFGKGKDREIREKERVLCPCSDLKHHCKHRGKEKSIGINTVRLHICHHQIIGTDSSTFSFFFFFFKIWEWNITFYWVFLLDRFIFDFSFDSFLFQAFGFSMKMFVFSIFSFFFFSLFWIIEITKPFPIF